jgi:hypothetical protein
MSTFQLPDNLEVDRSRATGRTTRMILAAAAYLAKDDKHTVTLISHDRNAQHWLEGLVRSLLSEKLANRVKYNYWRNAKITIDINRSDVFVDHHCYYADYVKAVNDLQAISLKFGEWDEH